MSIRKTFFLKLESAAKTLNKYLTNHISLISHKNCWKSNVLGQNYELFYWRSRHVGVFQITVVFVFVYNNKGVYEHEKTANLQ